LRRAQGETERNRVIGEKVVPRGFLTLRRGALLGAVLLLLVAALLVSASRSGAETCPDGASADICVPFSNVNTNEQGVYKLKIAGGLIGSQYVYPALKECTWHVSGDFGDGSPLYEGSFNTEIGIEVSHQYPAFGVYHASIDASEGKKPSEDPCSSVHITVTDTWKEPPPPKEPPSEPPPSEETGNGSGGPTGGGGGDGPTGGGGGGGGPEGETHEPGEAVIVYWSGCGRGVYVHRVGCPKAHTVLSKARPRFSRGLRSVRVAGFSCAMRPKALHRISCRRGSRRILAP
jgi:hypothetical protein